MLQPLPQHCDNDVTVTGVVRVWQESGALGAARRRLLEFLETSPSYDAATVVAALPLRDCFDERVLLLQRLRRVRGHTAVHEYVRGSS